MKRYGILVLALLMCCSMLAGCRRGNSMTETHSPTNEATAEAPTMPTAMPSTRPATEPATVQPTERETMEDTTGATENGPTDATEGSRSRTGPNRPATR